MSLRAQGLAPLFPITLGTAQLGMPYGKVVHVTPPTRSAVFALFDAAVAAGVNVFDTARIYQQAEGLVGDWLSGRARAADMTSQTPKILSKVHPFPEMPPQAIGRYLEEGFATTRRHLRVATLDSYLVHNAQDFLKPGVATFLRQLKADGLVRSTGVSIYEHVQLSAALDHAPDAVDFVQAPISIFDQRLPESRVVDRCVAEGIVLLGRSVFLQGVLYLAPDALPPFLAPLAPALRGLRALAGDSGRSLTALAIAGALVDSPVASLVIGVADQAQLDAAVDAIRRPVPADVARAARRACAGLPHAILDPRKWPALDLARA